VNTALTALIREETTGTIVGVLAALPKTFSTGSRGFYGGAKLEIDGRRYQCAIQMVEMGSKPVHAEAEPEPAA